MMCTWEVPYICKMCHVCKHVKFNRNNLLHVWISVWKLLKREYLLSAVKRFCKHNFNNVWESLGTPLYVFQSIFSLSLAANVTEKKIVAFPFKYSLNHGRKLIDIFSLLYTIFIILLFLGIKLTPSNFFKINNIKIHIADPKLKLHST